MGCAKSKGKARLARSASSFEDVPPCNATSDRMVQNVLLVWLDGNIDEKKSDCKNTITHLRRAINTINTFTEDDQCIQFLENTSDEKICMLISGSLAEQIVPRVHHLTQLDSIFIFCGHRKYHEKWVKSWSKIKGVFTKIGPICDALKQTAHQCEQNAVSIGILGDGSGNALNKTGNRLDPSFMYTQIMKEILLTIEFEQQHIDEFINHCRELLADNDRQLQKVDQFAQQYQQHTPIWWYTCDSFLYPMLNRALRKMNVDLIIKMGFFIGDLHRHIKQLHQQQFGSDDSKQQFTVYRGQGMEKDDFQMMMVNEGGLMSFNCFLSTSKNRWTSLDFVKRSLTNAQLVGVLFVINIDLKRPNTPFASVIDVGYYGAGEDEMLFSMHTVFRIGKITPMDGNDRLMQVQLNLASDNDNDLREMVNYIRKETLHYGEGWYRLGWVLFMIGEPTKACQMYEMLLEQASDERCRASIYNQLGVMRNTEGKYTEAIQYHEKSIAVDKNQVPRNDLNLASSYNNIGSVYHNMGDYLRALLSVETALAIQQQSLPPTHPHLAMSYMNIGNVYDSMGDYSKALSSYEKALAIQQQSLPPTHPALAMTYNNIGMVYHRMSNNPKALSSYEKALAIRQQSLPPTHPDLAMSYNNIGLVYDSMGNYSIALSLHETALAIKQQSLPPIHPDLGSSYNNIANVHSGMGDYPKALSSHERALAIKQQSLPPIHPDLAMSYNDIGLVYDNMGDYSKALSSHEKALAIRQQSLPPTHPDLASSYNNIGSVYHNMGDYPKAFLAYEKALVIQKRACCRKGRGFAATYNNIGLLHENTGGYWKAHSYYKHAMDLAQCSLPADHPDLLRWKCDLARVQQKFQ